MYDSNGIRSHKHLLRERTLNHLAKLELMDIQATTECRFALKRVCDMIRTQRHIYRYIKLFK